MNPETMVSLYYRALYAMEEQAKEMGLKGGAGVCIVDLNFRDTFNPMFRVFGSMTRGPKLIQGTGHKDNGANYLAVAMAKMAQMWRLWVPSGQTPMKGENDYRGGDMKVVPGFGLFACFSGGTADEDLIVARAGLAVMEEAFGNNTTQWNIFTCYKWQTVGPDTVFSFSYGGGAQSQSALIAEAKRFDLGGGDMKYFVAGYPAGSLDVPCQDTPLTVRVTSWISIVDGLEKTDEGPRTILVGMSGEESHEE